MKFWAWFLLVMAALWLLTFLGCGELACGCPIGTFCVPAPDGKTQCERAAWNVSIDGGSK